MKSYKNSRGRDIKGVSILEQILGSYRKTFQLNQVLKKSGLKIAPNAKPGNKDQLWITTV